MRRLLLGSLLTVLFSSVSYSQQQSYAYGQLSDLKGLRKIYVDTGADVQSRNSIIKDLEKSKLGFEIVDDIEEAEILLGFGAGRVTDRAIATITGSSTIEIREMSSRTGVGVVIARARGKDRLVHSFRSTQEGGRGVLGAALQHKPVTNFVREFIKVYKKGNDLK